MAKALRSITVCPCGPSPSEERFMAVLIGYFDESGKFKDHEIVAFCGLIATFDYWDRFNQEWQYLLRHYGLKSLHMKSGVLNFKRSLSPKKAVMGREARFQALEQFVRTIKLH